MKKIVVLLVCFWQPTWAQIRPMHEIEQLLDAEKNDSALLALQPHLAVNKNSYTYFRALLNEGIALFQSGQTTKAIGRFHEVQNALVRKPFPDLLARADLKLASIHESAHAGEHCKHYLLRAEEQIEKFSLDSLRPELYIRKSSYFRVFEEKSQMQPYLEKVFELASKYRKYKEMAEAHLLSEAQYDVTEADAKIRHLDQGIHFYALAGNSPGTSAMYFLKGRIYRKIHQPDKAMAMVDSSIYYARKVPEVQHYEYLAHPYGLKAELLEEQGQLKSAIQYLRDSYSYHYAVTSRNAASKVAEAEALHQLDRQQYEFKMASRLKNGILWIGGTGLCIALILIGVIFRYARRIKLANQHLEEQAATITEQSFRLEHLMTTKNQFFANISHELRTPLTLMLSPLNTLIKEGKWTEKQSKLLQTVQQGGNNLEFLVQQILDLGKLDSGQVTLHLEEVVARSYFENLMAQFESLAEARGILYFWKVQVQEAEIWLIDREKIRQILYNLLGNAFKFTPSGGQVSADLIQGEGMYHLLISDTGIGISEEDKNQIFERYYQEDGREGGLGLGLGICREYAELMKGSVEVQSNGGAGSSFQVNLPIQKGSQVHTKPASGQRLDHVLIVEDNRQVREYLRFLLQDLYQVSTVENGERALAFLQESNQIDLILTDLMMPTMGGMNLVSTLKAQPETRGIPVIMLTARDAEDTRIDALRIGVDDYIQKPFREEELLVRIQNLLNNYAQRKGQGAEVLPSADRRWLEDFEAYMEKHYGNPELSIPQVSEVFFMSESTLLRTLKRLTGLSTHQYLQEVRLKKAYLLIKGKKFNSIQEVAFHCGYKDTKTFSRAFKNRFGVLPSAID